MKWEEMSGQKMEEEPAGSGLVDLWRGRSTQDFAENFMPFWHLAHVFVGYIAINLILLLD